MPACDPNGTDPRPPSDVVQGKTTSGGGIAEGAIVLSGIAEGAIPSRLQQGEDLLGLVDATQQRVCSAIVGVLD